MKNALSAEEREEGNQVPKGMSGYMEDVYVHYDDRHALAARCLFEQPLGFTREDVEDLRKISRQSEEAWWLDDLSSLADRIENLLPPEEEG